ncbi:hypothetical protein BC940DRAFT_239402 [Gongronella butleri]|nr:hypothetical protein BC940DRAFT_239402 [Gongronella butleri]
MSDTNDDFKVAEVFEQAPLDDDAKARDEKRAKRKEKQQLTAEEKEEKRRINRESREKKKLLKEKNKKRKRGEEVSSDEEDEVAAKEGPSHKGPKKSKADKEKQRESEHGVWVGNLAFRTSRDNIEAFFAPCGEITRINSRKGPGNQQNRGFAYVMFSNEESVDKAIALSEQELDGRKLLIKNAKDYQRKDGMDKQEVKKAKNPPCPTLFVGNLPFTATKESLRAAFEWAGNIRSVRLGTFEDTGKCKGFGYVDFDFVEDATKAIRAPDKHVLDDRKMRVEFATEEAHKRSMPWLMRRERADQRVSQGDQRPAASAAAKKGDDAPARPEKVMRERPARREKSDAPKKKSNERMKPGEALSNALRQKPTVQAFKGTKITFD